MLPKKRRTRLSSDVGVAGDGASCKCLAAVRCERFTDAVLELYDSFEKGYVSLEDIHLTLKEETGITIVSDGS
mgnify:CR=1 FL=1